MNLFSCYSFSKKVNSAALLKCPKSIFEYYFSKGFAIWECNTNNFGKLPNKVKQIINSEETENSEKVMTSINTIPSTSNTLKNLLLNKSLHSSYIQTEFNEKKGIINNTFITDVEPFS